MAKYIAYLLIAATFFVACKNEEKKAPAGLSQSQLDLAMADSGTYTTIQWLDTLVNFGTVEESAKVNVKFRYKNTGTKQLIIASAVAGCACTVPDFNKAPIMPGKEGEITAVFNSTGQPKNVHKFVNVVANTLGTQQHQLTFTGEIKKANK